MRKQEIRREFNKKVAELMAEGYEIFPDSMSGSQGEIAKIDLVKDGKIVRVYLEKGYKAIRDGEAHRYADVIVLVVGTATGVDANNFRWSDIVWNSKLQDVSTTVWVEMSDRRDGWYVPEADALESLRKQYQRYCARRDGSWFAPVSEAYKPVVHRWLKRQPGFRKTGINAIEEIRKHFRDDRVYIEVKCKGRWLTVLA